MNNQSKSDPSRHQSPRGHAKFKWSDDDKRFLLKNYKLMTLDELAKETGKNRTQVKNQCQRMMLTKRDSL